MHLLLNSARDDSIVHATSDKLLMPLYSYNSRHLEAHLRGQGPLAAVPESQLINSGVDIKKKTKGFTLTSKDPTAKGRNVSQLVRD